MSDTVIKHATVSVYILSDGQPRKALLLHHRKHSVWMPPGGHQETHENPLEAAIRETIEETGLDITPYLPKSRRASDHAQYLPAPQYVLESKIPAHGDEPEHYHIDFEYIITIPEQAVAHQPAESHDIGWFTLEELADLSTFEDIRTVLTEELAK